MTLDTTQDYGLLEVDRILPLDETAGDFGPDMLALLLDELAHGTLIINVRGRILHANQAARRELDSAALIGNEMGELKFASSEHTLKFEAAIAKAVLGKRSLIRLTAQGTELTLALVPLHRRAGIRCDRIALFLSRAAVSESGVFSSFARSYRLTQTEEQVLAFLCQGLATPEIAVKMKVAVSTIRSHVRSACAKTASRGARELINRVATLPPVAPLLFGQFR